MNDAARHDLDAFATIPGRRHPLHAICDALPVLVSYVDPTQTYRFVNQAYERWFGHSRHELVGKHLREVIGKPAYELVRPHLEAALAGQSVRFEASLPYLYGGERFVDAIYVPDVDTGQRVRGISVMVFDITERKRLEDSQRESRAEAMERERRYARELEQAADRIARLQQATSSLASSLTPREVADTLLGLCESVLGAAAGVVYLADGEGGLRLEGARGVPRPLGPLQVLAGDAKLPLAEAIRHGASVWVESYAELVRRYPLTLDAQIPASRLQALAALPLRHGGRIVGGFVVSFDRELRFDAGAQQWLQGFAAQAAVAADRARLYEAELTARREAQTLFRIAEALNETNLELEALVQRVTDEATQLVGAQFGAFFYNVVGQDGEAYLLYTLSGAPKEAFAKFGLPRNTPIFAPTFAGHGVMRLHDVKQDPRYGRVPPHHGMPKGHLPVTSYLAAPVISRSGEVIGGLFFGHPEPGRFTAQHERLLKGVAANAAVAIDNARLLRAAREAEEAQARRAREALLARDIGAILAETGPLEPRLLRSCELAVQQLAAARAEIWGIDQRSELTLVAAAGFDPGVVTAPASDAAVAVQAGARAPLPYVTNDAPHDPHLEHLAWLRREGIQAYASYPLVVGDQLVGSLRLFVRRPLPEDTLDALSSVARTLALGIQRARAEADRENMLCELERTVRYNEMFAGILGHDLRNPLGAILTAAELIARRTDDENTRRPLQRIVTSGQRMSKMIDQLLDFTRARIGGGVLLKRRGCDLGELARQSVEEVELAGRRLSIRLESPGELNGHWDPDRLLQVFSNLLSNAVQHGSAEAPVVVRLSADEVRRQARVEVHNQGVIPAELLPILFEPFRGTEHRRDGSRGLGLGLFITERIVAAHGGSISVASSAADGTTFTVLLPRAPDGAPAPA